MGVPVLREAGVPGGGSGYHRAHHPSPAVTGGHPLRRGGGARLSLGGGEEFLFQ